MPGSNLKVRVYSTPSCPFCAMTKKFLGEHRIEFEDINVAADREAAREMIEKSGQMGVPVIEIGGNIIIGFDRERMKKLLNIRN